MKTLYITIFVLMGVMSFAQKSTQKVVTKTEKATIGAPAEAKQEVPNLTMLKNSKATKNEELVSEQSVPNLPIKTTAPKQKTIAVKPSNKLVSEQ